MNMLEELRPTLDLVAGWKRREYEIDGEAGYVLGAWMLEHGEHVVAALQAAQRVHSNLDEHNGFATCRADLKHELGKALEPFQENP